jgi:3-oxoacyl-[acyl-carrier-protein] synthase II
MSARIVITGIGVVSPLGIGKEAFWRGSLEGRSVFKQIQLFETARFSCKRAAEVNDLTEHIPPKVLKEWSRSAKLACTAALLAIRDASLNLDAIDPSRIGVVLGTVRGSIASMIRFDQDVFQSGPRHVDPLLFPNTVHNSAAGYVSIHFGIAGLNTTLSTGPSSGLEAIRYAVDSLEKGDVSIVLAGGGDELCLGTFLGLLKSGQLADSERSVPFDRNRTGLTLGEGAAFLVIERLEDALERKATILAEIAGYASHFCDGDGWENCVELKARVMAEAIRSSGHAPDEVSCIWASANGSVLGDRMETQAIGRVFGKKAGEIPLTAIKSMIGECDGASGPLQVAGAVLSLSRNCLPPTVDFKEPDPGSPLGGISSSVRIHHCRVAMVNAFGPKGMNATMILKRWGRGDAQL